MDTYLLLEKKVGETPLSCLEAYRTIHPELADIPLAYAGRLDPMASGKLLILVGDECKNQEQYHGLDKEYEFSVLFGIESDSQDVLGRLQTCATVPTSELTENLSSILPTLSGNIELPYPIFSAKTVQGKPLHTWTMEGRLDEIEIPTKQSTIYELELLSLETMLREPVCDHARNNIDTIPPVTDIRKALGNDFRRVDVRKDWENIRCNDSLPDAYTIAHFRCIASSGTYMRTLASSLAKKFGTCGLASRIHRTTIGTYNQLTSTWEREF